MHLTRCEPAILSLRVSATKKIERLSASPFAFCEFVWIVYALLIGSKRFSNCLGYCIDADIKIQNFSKSAELSGCYTLLVSLI